MEIYVVHIGGYYSQTTILYMIMICFLRCHVRIDDY